MSKKRKALVFDVDGTISIPNLPIDEKMASAMMRLLSLSNIKVCILTAKSFPQIQYQVLDQLVGVTSGRLKKLHLGVLQGTELYDYNQATKTWIGAEGNFIISYDDERAIRYALEAAAKKCGYWMPETLSPSARYIENRGGQITFSGLGNEADVVDKVNWDPDKEKRKEIIEVAMMIDPRFEYKIGGTTSIDVTMSGHNKATGLSRILKHLKLKPEDIIYFGDEMYEGGNDYPVKETGLYDVREVYAPEMTLAAIETFISTRF